MPMNNSRLSLFDFVMSLSQLIDLVSPNLARHNLTVAYIAYEIGFLAGLSDEELDTLILAGSLHDIGALTDSQKLRLLQFDSAEYTNACDEHCLAGYKLLKTSSILGKLADVILDHHKPFVFMDPCNQLPLCNIINLADRVAILIDYDHNVLLQSSTINNKIIAMAGKQFSPLLVEKFLQVSEREYFWFNIVYGELKTFLSGKVRYASADLTTDVLLDVAQTFSFVVDFRSKYTSTHSARVAITAEELARLFGFSNSECTLMRISGLMHDLGKLAIPTELLEKAGPLDQGESLIMKKHIYLTFILLEGLAKSSGKLVLVRDWAAHHHERLDGKGYPFRLDTKQLSLGARIMQISDIFSALKEDRPYRKGMTNEEVDAVMTNMVSSGAIDGRIYGLLNENAERIVEMWDQHFIERQIHYDDIFV